MTEAGDRSYQGYQVAGLVLGPALSGLILVMPAPVDLSPAGWATAAVAVLMAIWWATEALPLAATALVPLVLFPLLGIFDVQQTAAPFANPLIFLFLGGFLIALAVQRWDLHRRIALNIVMRVGQRPLSLVAGAMLATAALSMWISNTATTMMMLPIAASLIAVTRDHEMQSETGDANTGDANKGDANFATSMMLGIAYAASIGGLATLIGSPPNALAASYMLQTFSVEVTFASWMALALPITVVMLPLAWVILTRVAFPFPNQAGATPHAVPDMLEAMGPMSAAEKRVAAVFAVVATGWILHPLTGDALGAGAITDTGLAIAGAVALFAIPADWRTRTFLLDWPTARKVPWEILILFGGGLSLAQGIDRTGLAAWLGGGLEFLTVGPAILLIAGVAVFVILLTELTSNTATTAAFLPVAGALAIGADLAPLLLAAPVALAASAAFMLPVATPPNAIVFGSGHVTLPQMMRAGIYLNVAGVIVITTALMLLALD
jgi:solute carrier family 13 (sodium-dependent dicarboxylate transporter), member 2/3/5